jgi:hypothetical protein
VTIRDLSEQLAAWETGKERAAVRPKERKCLYTALHQTHLPQMDRFGVVDYDRNRGTVALTDRSTTFDDYLDQTPGEGTVPWNAVSLALGGLLLAVLGVAIVDVAPLSAIDGYVYALVAVGLFTALSLVRVFDGYRRERATPDTLVPPAELDEPAQD